MTTGSVKSVEARLRRHYAASSAELSAELSRSPEGVDFRAMAKRAVASENVRPTFESSDPLEQVADMGWAGHTNQRRQRRYGGVRLGTQVGYAVAGLLMAFGLLRVSFYFAPNWQQSAYAAVKSLLPFATAIAPQDAGLRQLAAQGKIEAMDISTKSHGIVLQVVGSYADSVRSTLFLRAEGMPPNSGGLAGDTGGTQPGTLVSGATATSGPGSWWPNLQSVTLTDQFGHHYSLQSSIWNIDAGEGTLQFTGIPDWRAGLGVHLQLNIQGLQWVTRSGNGPLVQGLWRASWTQAAAGAAVTLVPNSKADSNGVQITLNSVVLSPSATQLRVSSLNARATGGGSGSSSGSAPGSASSGAGSPMKPAVANQFYVVQMATGERFPMLSGGAMSFGPLVSEQIVMQPLAQPGAYKLVVTRFNGKAGLWELPFTIR